MGPNGVPFPAHMCSGFGKDHQFRYKCKSGCGGIFGELDELFHHYCEGQEEKDVRKQSLRHAKTRPSAEAPPPSSSAVYSCTREGCGRRFETIDKLKLHHKSDHAAIKWAPYRQTLLCEQLNPSTGKPCNLIFAQPHNFTRHEHSIHGTGRQGIRCPVCGVTFSHTGYCV